MNGLAVSTKQLTKAFGGREVVHNCNLSVEPGTIYGLVGPNGAGKTTIFKLLLGLLKPTMGQAAVLGLDSVRDNCAILRRTGSFIEAPIFYEHLSAADNLQIHLAYLGAEGANFEEVFRMVGLPHVGAQPVSTFSMGMRQRLGIARALVHKPELLILDEPTNGLDPIGIREIRILFSELVQREKITILLSSHILSEIEQMADKIGFISNGEILQEADAEYVKQNAPTGLEDYFMQVIHGGADHETTRRA